MNKNKSVCRKCNASIFWIEDKHGNKIAVDKTPILLYQVKEGIGELIEVYQMHWCRGEKNGN